jgi:hypothetical protein
MKYKKYSLYLTRNNSIVMLMKVENQSRDYPYLFMVICSGTSNDVPAHAPGQQYWVQKNGMNKTGYPFKRNEKNECKGWEDMSITYKIKKKDIEKMYHVLLCK